MASSEKHSSGLNKWLEDDKPTMWDFLEDNEILDAHIEDKENPHEVTAEQVQGLAQIVENLQSQISNIQSTTLKQIYPVGSIYASYNNVSPATVLGFGTWQACFVGKSPIGVNPSDGDFNVSAKTGGAKTVALSAAMMPSHNHSIPGLSGYTSNPGNYHQHTFSNVITSSDGNHTHRGENNEYFITAYPGAGLVGGGGYYYQARYATAYAGNHNHSVSGATSWHGSHTHSVATYASASGSNGSGSAHTNMHPYETAYFWRRTA